MREFDATGLRGHGRRRRRSKRCVGINPCTHEVEAPSVRGVPVTRAEVGIVASFRNFIGTGAEKAGLFLFFSRQEQVFVVYMNSERPL